MKRGRRSKNGVKYRPLKRWNRFVCQWTGQRRQVFCALSSIGIQSSLWSLSSGGPVKDEPVGYRISVIGEIIQQPSNADKISKAGSVGEGSGFSSARILSRPRVSGVALQSGRELNVGIMPNGDSAKSDWPVPVSSKWLWVSGRRPCASCYFMTEHDRFVVEKQAYIVSQPRAN